jgi:alpha-1,2-mannosyltransferase
VRTLAVLLVVGASAAYVALNALHQWDFETYYFAAGAVRAGLDPYRLQWLSSVAGKPVELPYLYPPVTLCLFLPLSYLPLGVASLVWLGAKCLLAGVLIWIWSREFLRSVPRDVVLVVALLGFDLALLWDLRTGNVALIEQALLWFGFLFYLRGRVLIAAVLIALAATFKLYPILFLLLLVLPPVRRGNVRAVAIAFALLALLVILPFAALGSWKGALSAALAGDRPVPAIDPSAFTIIGWGLSHAGPGSQPSRWIELATYSIYALLLLAASARALLRTARSADPEARVVIAMLVWFLLSPRVMVYAYVSAVVPALYVVHARIKQRHWRLAASLVLIIPGIVRLFPGQPPGWVGIISYLTMLAVWALWLGVGSTHRPEGSPGERRSVGDRDQSFGSELSGGLQDVR